MTEIDETELPGIGIRREFTTRGGKRLGVIANRTGKHDLLLYDSDDPDMCSTVVPLDERDTDVLAELLGATSGVSDAASTLINLEGIAIDWVGIDAGSEFAGKTIGEAEIRSRTGASIAAVLHRGDSVPDPGPDTVLTAGAQVVAVGTPGAVEQLAELLGA
ncbi:MAG: cation:proton antiporter regulatory subunit [Actinomycetia bacterium]|nr:cation:proton antiporter regulatory subunit [Actinomycetes bacterium]